MKAENDLSLENKVKKAIQFEEKMITNPMFIDENKAELQEKNDAYPTEKSNNSNYSSKQIPDDEEMANENQENDVEMPEQDMPFPKSRPQYLPTGYVSTSMSGKQPTANIYQPKKYQVQMQQQKPNYNTTTSLSANASKLELQREIDAMSDEINKLEDQCRNPSGSLTEMQKFALQRKIKLKKAEAIKKQNLMTQFSQKK